MFLIFKFCSNLLFNMFLDLYMLGFCCGMGSEKKPNVLGGVGTCLGRVLIQGRLKLSKKPFHLHSCICMRHACVCSQPSSIRTHSSCVRIHVHQFIRTHALVRMACVCVRRVPTCVRIHVHNAYPSMRTHAGTLRTHT